MLQRRIAEDLCVPFMEYYLCRAGRIVAKQRQFTSKTRDAALDCFLAGVLRLLGIAPARLALAGSRSGVQRVNVGPQVLELLRLGEFLELGDIECQGAFSWTGHAASMPSPLSKASRQVAMHT
jgi:hypothetical protein